MRKDGFAAARARACAPWSVRFGGIGLRYPAAMLLAFAIAAGTPAFAGTLGPTVPLPLDGYDAGDPYYLKRRFHQYPHAAMDDAGAAVAVWASRGPSSISHANPFGTDRDILFARSTDGGRTWAKAQFLNDNAGTDGSETDHLPRVAEDGAGNWVTVWAAASSLGGSGVDDYDIFFSRSTDSGASWSTPGLLNSDATTDGASADDEFPAAAGSGGTFVAVWRGDHAAFTHRLFMSRSVDGGATWSAKTLFADDVVDPGELQDAPEVATDGNGNWVVTWWQTSPLGSGGRAVMAVRSTDDGATWSAPVLLYDDEGLEPRVAADGAGVWMIVFYSFGDLGGTIGGDYDILAVRSADDGATWSAPFPLNTTAATDSNTDLAPDIASDGEGGWIAVWTGFPFDSLTTGHDRELAAARSSDGGLTWSDPELLNTTAAVDYQRDRFARIATGGTGDWTVVWLSENEPVYTHFGYTVCGNGEVGGNEECDDGNTINGDGCSSRCTFCGNGVVAAPELCDDGNDDDGDGCTSSCTPCGDGLLQGDEECDDGNASGGDGCSPACKLETCVPASSPQAWFPFDYAGDGRNIANNGTPQMSFGADAFVDPEGMALGAITLDGSGDHAGAVYDGAWNLNSAFTIEGWVRPDSLDGTQSLLSLFTNAGGTSRGWTFELQGSSVAWTNRTFGGSLNTVVSSGGLQVGRWYHLATTRGPGNTHKLYIDGQEVDTAEYTTATTNVVNSLCVGCRPLNGGIDLEFEGAIDEITMYPSSLDATAIEAIYDAGSGGKCKGCGDNVRSTGEECDGTDDDECPGLCNGSCECPIPGCGNDIDEIGEDCDGVDDDFCPGLCNSDCTCPVCGNGVREPGETCDGTDASACQGSCELDCSCPDLPDDEVDNAVVAGGGTLSTDGEADGVDIDDPAETTVTTPNAGVVTIAETAAPAVPHQGFHALGYEVVITAPAASVADPLEIEFLFDGSLIPSWVNRSSAHRQFAVFLNATKVPDCTGAPQAIPDPCVVNFGAVGDDDYFVTVLSANTSGARGASGDELQSSWNFGIPGGMDAQLGYKGGAAKKDAENNKLTDNFLPRGYDVTLDDVLVDDASADDPENYTLGKPAGMANPAAIDGADIGDLFNPDSQLVRYRAKVSKTGFAGGKGVRALARTWETDGPLGTLNVSTGKVTAVLAPVSTGLEDDIDTLPPTENYFLCYQARNTADDSDQTVAGKLRKDLQAYAEDQFGDCENDALGDPQFPATSVAGKCLFDLKKVVEICSPATVSGAPVEEDPVDEALDFDDVLDDVEVNSLADTTTALLCYQAKQAKAVRNDATAALIGAATGDKLAAKQARHAARSVRNGTPVLAASQLLPAPGLVETKGPDRLCLPVDVTAVSEIGG